MLIGIIVIVSLSLLILGHEAGHFFVAKLFGMKVDEFGFGFPPEMIGIDVTKFKLPRHIVSFKKGETRYTVNWLPLGGFVKITGEVDGLQSPSEISAEDKRHLFRFQAWWKRALVLAAGVSVNFVIGWFLISAVFIAGSPPALAISGIQQNSPAAQAGIESGDIIKNFTRSDDFIAFVNSHRGQEISLSVIRGGKEITFHITPRINVGPNEGALGVLLEEGGLPSEGFIQGFRDGLLASVKIVGFSFIAFYQLVHDLVFTRTLLSGVVGPIGIVSVASEASRIGFIYFVGILSQISLGLAVVNFLPLPALDGGQFLLVIIESIKRSPLFSKRTEGLLNGIAFLILILLVVLISIRDVYSRFT